MSPCPRAARRGAQDGTRKMIHLPTNSRDLSIANTVICLTVAVPFLTLLLVGCQPRSAERDAKEESAEVETRSPLEVVNLRMQAYNAHDLDAFLSTYSEKVEIFTYPDKSLGKGKKHIKSLFEDMFREGSVRVDIHHQITKDSYVVNHETVVSGDKKTEYVSIYEVRKGLIRSVRFVRD